METKEYRRFAEFCDACRRYRYIRLCHGPPGAGKSLSALHYAQWEAVEPVFLPSTASLSTLHHGPTLPAAARSFTPPTTTTPKRLETELHQLCFSLHYLMAAAHDAEEEPHHPHFDDGWTELVILDEADRLKFPTLEQLCDVYDRGHFGLVLVGMPGIEPRLSRYGQFHSRVGFVHQFRPLSAIAAPYVFCNLV